MPAATPTYGLRYLELADPPDIAGMGEDLATDVEAELSRVDTVAADHEARLAAVEPGAVAVTTLTPTYAGMTGSLRVREIVNGVVACVGDLDIDTATGGGFVNTGCLVPVGMRPTAQVFVVSNSYNSANQFRFRFDTDGTVWFQHTGADATIESVNAVWFTP